MTKDEIQASIFGQRARRKSVEVRFGDGEPITLDVIAPSIAVREEFGTRSKDKGVSRALAYLVVVCTVMPGSEERVFGDDIDAAVEKIVKLDGDDERPHVILAEAAVALMSEGVKQGAKKS